MNFKKTYNKRTIHQNKKKGDKMKKKMLLIAVLGSVAIYGGSVTAQDAHAHNHDSDHAHDHSGHHKEIIKTLTVGDNIATIKLTQNKTAGKVTLQILKSDKKTALVIEKAPRINLIVEEKRKQLKTTVVGEDKSKYEVSSDILKKDINGKISIKIGENTYQVAINPHEHGAGCAH